MFLESLTVMEVNRFFRLLNHSSACYSGKEVACFVRNHFLPTLLQRESFLKKKYEQALTETFLEMDEMLLKPEFLDEIICFEV